jgi:4-hydroxybenzoyl-CoA thioesterase
MPRFIASHKVRFSDTDFAGIIFYPRYFEMLNAVAEDWFEQALGASFGELLKDHDVGSPMGKVETTFVSPCQLGEIIRFELAAERVTNRTVTILVEAFHGEDLRVRTVATHVCSKRDISGATNWPNGMKEKMQMYLPGGPAT